MVSTQNKNTIMQVVYADKKTAKNPDSNP